MRQTKPNGTPGPDAPTEKPVRARILGAAFRAFTENGYAGTSTLDIATRAKVSKRELYAQFGNKRAMLVACVSLRAKRMRLPPELPAPDDRPGLARTLETYGAILLREISHPTVTAVYRLAIAEAVRSPEVAQVLDTQGREANRAALGEILAHARAARILKGGAEPREMAAEFLALLWKDLLISVLLGVAKPPSAKEVERRARNATTAFLKLYSPM
jgi:AcrR family transcriptional regulator